MSENKSAWAPISTAPKDEDGPDILIWNKDWECPKVAYWNDDKDHSVTDFDDPKEGYWAARDDLNNKEMGIITGASHWLGIPKPPG